MKRPRTRIMPGNVNYGDDEADNDDNDDDTNNDDKKRLVGAPKLCLAYMYS